MRLKDLVRFTTGTARERPRHGGRNLLVALVLVLACTGGALFLASTASGANPAANLDQCANDPAPSSHLDGCNSSASQWVNGNLGSSKSVYQEGDSIPYRLTF